MEYATLLVEDGQAIPAIQLLAAAHRLGTTQENPEHFHAHPLFTELVERARRQTDAVSYQDAWDTGATLTLTQIQQHLFPPYSPLDV